MAKKGKGRAEDWVVSLPWCRGCGGRPPPPPHPPRPRYCYFLSFGQVMRDERERVCVCVFVLRCV